MIIPVGKPQPPIVFKGSSMQRNNISFKGSPFQSCAVPFKGSSMQPQAVSFGNSQPLRPQGSMPLFKGGTCSQTITITGDDGGCIVIGRPKPNRKDSDNNEVTGKIINCYV